MFPPSLPPPFLPSLNKNMQRNWGFAINSNSTIFISLQPGGVKLWYFKLRFFDLTEFIVQIKYIRSTTMGLKMKGNRRSEFVTKTIIIFWVNCYISRKIRKPTSSSRRREWNKKPGRMCKLNLRNFNSNFNPSVWFTTLHLKP